MLEAQYDRLPLPDANGEFQEPQVWAAYGIFAVSAAYLLVQKRLGFATLDGYLTALVEERGAIFQRAI